MRIYIPLTFPGLVRLHEQGEVGPAPFTARAVTATLREWYLAGDEEELEAAALADAARASLVLLAQDAFAVRRRVVLAADVPDAGVTPLPDAGRATVRVRVPVPLAVVVAVHVDAPDARRDVAAAVTSLAAAAVGDEDARWALDGVEDHGLLWYATQEIPDVLAEG